MTTNIEYNHKEINDIIIQNVLKMLERRGLISSHIDEFDKIKLNNSEKTIYEILLEDKSICHINIINAKLTTLSSGSQIDDYLSNNVEIYKFLIIKEFTKKIIKDIIANYLNVEVFLMSEMMEDLPSKIFISEHKKLNTEELNELFSKFNENEFAKILVTDKMCRYYGGKIGDIFKITRPSFTSGKNIFYRRVVNGTWDILF